MSIHPTKPKHPGPTASPLTRREVLSASALAGGALLLAGRSSLAQPGTPPPGQHSKSKEENPARKPEPAPRTPFAPGEPGKDYTPVIVPNGWTLPYTVVDGV